MTKTVGVQGAQPPALISKNKVVKVTITEEILVSSSSVGLNPINPLSNYNAEQYMYSYQHFNQTAFCKIERCNCLVFMLT